MAKIRAIVKRTDEQYGHVTNISSTLKNLQKIVEGPIETVKVMEDMVIICNEEGKLRGLDANFVCGQDIIVGEVAVVGVDGEEFSDVPIDLPTWKWILKSWGNQICQR